MSAKLTKYPLHFNIPYSLHDVLKVDISSILLTLAKINNVGKKKLKKKNNYKLYNKKLFNYFGLPIKSQNRNVLNPFMYKVLCFKQSELTNT